MEPPEIILNHMESSITITKSYLWNPYIKSNKSGGAPERIWVSFVNNFALLGPN